MTSLRAPSHESFRAGMKLVPARVHFGSANLPPVHMNIFEPARVDKEVVFARALHFLFVIFSPNGAIFRTAEKEFIDSLLTICYYSRQCSVALAFYVDVPVIDSTSTAEATVLGPFLSSSKKERRNDDR